MKKRLHGLLRIPRMMAWVIGFNRAGRQNKRRNDKNDKNNKNDKVSPIDDRPVFFRKGMDLAGLGEEIRECRTSREAEVCNF